MDKLGRLELSENDNEESIAIDCINNVPIKLNNLNILFLLRKSVNMT